MLYPISVFGFPAAILEKLSSRNRYFAFVVSNPVAMC